MKNPSKRTAQLLNEHAAAILEDWKAVLFKRGGRQASLLTSDKLAEECRRFLRFLAAAVAENLEEDDSESWENLKRFLAETSREWTAQGFTPSDTAGFVFSIKEVLFKYLRGDLENNRESFEDVWRVNLLIDRLGLYTIEVHIQAREEVIERQQEDLLEISTPVVSLWDGILALPIIGTLDSERTQVMMESLLRRIVETESEIAIIDITGVAAVDTLVAQHLIKTVTAARLMGAECIISGIRPQIAQTIVHLGVDLGDSIVTKSTLASAFGHALRRRRLKVVQD